MIFTLIYSFKRKNFLFFSKMQVSTLRNVTSLVNSAKNLLEMEPAMAESLYESAIQQITALRSADIVNKKDEWLTELDRIHREITDKIAGLRLRRRKEHIMQSSDMQNKEKSKIPEWNDPLLQQRFQIQLAETIILPVMYPQIQPMPRKVIVIKGPPKSGKTFTIQAIRSFMQASTGGSSSSLFMFHFFLSFQFQEMIDVFLSQPNELLKYRNIILVVDKLSAEQWSSWKDTNWFQSFVQFLRSFPRIIFVIIADNFSDEIFPHDSALKPLEIQFQLPNRETVYFYMKTLILSLSGLKSEIPLLEKKEDCVDLANLMHDHHSANFENIVEWVRRGIQLSHEICVEDSVFLRMGDVWVPRLARKSESMNCRILFSSHAADNIQEAALVRSIPIDAVEFEGEIYYHEKLIDNFVVCEPDRGMDLFVKRQVPFEKDDQKFCGSIRFSRDSNSLQQQQQIDVIMRFQIFSSQYPDFINAVIYKGFYPYLFATWINLWKHEASIELKSSEMQNVVQLVSPHLSTIVSAEDIYFCKKEVAEMLLKTDVRQTFGVFTRPSLAEKQVLIVESDLSDATFSIHYGSRSDSRSRKKAGNVTTVTGGASEDLFKDPKKEANLEALPKNMQADELAKIIDHLLEAENSCQILQIRTSRGYEYYIDFFVPLRELFTCRISDRKGRCVMYPRVQSIVVHSELVDDYCITNEIDLDLLQEKYPQEYRECFRDEEETWKLKSLKDSKHLLTLNHFYTREHKFYLNLLFHLHVAKRDLYAEMDAVQKHELDSLQEDVQNLIDYSLGIVAEKDEHGVWDGVFSLSKNHSAVQREEPLRNSYDLSRQWLRRDLTFWINPAIFEKIQSVMGLENELVTAYSLWHKCREEEDTSLRTQEMYVQASIPLDSWDRAKTTYHLLPLCETDEICDRLKNSDYVLYYKDRVEESLFHIIFQNANAVGMKVNSANAVSAEVIDWYVINENSMKKIKAFVERVKYFDNAWHLLLKSSSDISSRQLLFSLFYMSLQNSEDSKSFLSHLFYFGKIYQNPLELTPFSLQSFEIYSVIERLDKKLDFLLQLLSKHKHKQNQKHETDKKYEASSSFSATGAEVTTETEKIAASAFASDRFFTRKAFRCTIHRLDSRKNLLASEDYAKIRASVLQKHHIQDQLFF